MCKNTLRFTLLLSLTILCFFNIIAQQTKVYLPLLETINLKKDFQYSSTRLLKNYIESANKFQVIMQDVNDSTISYNDQNVSIIAKAREKNTMYYITGSLNRLGENVIVNINLYETETGKKVWFDQLKAMNPDDLDEKSLRDLPEINEENAAKILDDIIKVSDNNEFELSSKEELIEECKEDGESIDNEYWDEFCESGKVDDNVNNVESYFECLATSYLHFQFQT
jgi:TolB-like protein